MAFKRRHTEGNHFVVRRRAVSRLSAVLRFGQLLYVSVRQDKYACRNCVWVSSWTVRWCNACGGLDFCADHVRARKPTPSSLDQLF